MMVILLKGSIILTRSATYKKELFPVMVSGILFLLVHWSLAFSIGQSWVCLSSHDVKYQDGIHENSHQISLSPKYKCNK